MYGGSDAQIDYRLGLVQHGCDSDAQLGYHTDARERALMWIGEGLSAFEHDDLRAGHELTEDQFEMARRLIRGQHPVTGQVLVAPKVAVPAAAKVSLGPLVAAVNEAAQTRGVAPGSLFGGVAAGRAWASAVRGVARRGGLAVTRVDEAVALAEAAGLRPGEVWGQQRVADARAALYEPRAVVDEAGVPVVRSDGTPKMEVVERRERVGIAGYDIGINVPKSMSVLLAMAPEDLTERIETIYARAASRTFSWTEARTSYVKRGHHGDGKVARHEQTAGLSGWVMTHRTARPVGELAVGDPHWHVHITVANMARTPPDAGGESKWLTIASGGRDLMRHAPAIDKITQGLVRGELNAQFGIEFARSSRTGVWEVAHIPERVNELFSKRGQQVTKALEALGYGPGQVSPKTSRVLTRACRSGKSETTAAADTTLRQYWRAQAVAAGYDPASWMPAVLAGYQAGTTAGPTAASTVAASMAVERANETMAARYGVSFDDVVVRLADPEVGLAAHTRRFSHQDAIAAVADALRYLRSETEIVALTDLVLGHPNFVALPDKTSDHAHISGTGTQLAGSHTMAGGALFTTRAVIEAEQVVLGRVRAAVSETGYVTVPARTVALAIAVAEAQQGYQLSGEQRAAVETVVSSGAGLAVIEGAAGTGKTTMMRATRVAYEAAGYTVGGAATAAVAAQGLAAESGIGSRTVAQWTHAIAQQEGGLRGVDVLVVDEANLTDDADRASLYLAGQQTGTKIVEIGDPKQLRAPGAGSSFGYIHTALNGPRLLDNRRQQDEDARRAVAAWRDGRYLDSLHVWEGRGGVVATHTTDEAVAALVEGWIRAAQGAPDPHTRAGGLLVTAATNEQVTRLNEAIQGARQVRGELGAGQVFAMPGGRSVEFRVGDQVIVRTNDRFSDLGDGDPVLNGYRGVVTGVSPGGVALAWRQPDDEPGQAPHTGTRDPEFIAAGGLDLGYALTGHKSEGMTIKAEWDRPDGTRNRGTTLVWGPGMDAAGGYVTITRAAGDTIIVAPLEELEGDRERLHYGTPADQRELTERAIAAIAAKAAATQDNPDDRPVLVDLGQAPTVEEWRIHHGAQASAQTPVADTQQAATAAEHEPLAATVHIPVERFPEPLVAQEPAAAVDTPEVGEHTDTAIDTAIDIATAIGEVSEQEREREQRWEREQELRWDRWRELTGAVYDAEASCDPEALRAAFDDRRGYEREVMGEVGQQLMAQSGTWEQYCAAREVTGEQRARWAELGQRSAAAWLGGDAGTREVIDAEQLAYSGELGEARARRLHLETMHELDQRAAQAQRESERARAERDQAVADRQAAVVAEREIRAGWVGRPHSTLSDDQLTRAITAAEHKRAVNFADALQARQEYTVTEPAVAAGHGPRVVALDRSLVELRRVADVHQVGEELTRRMWEAERSAGMAGAEARHKELEAAATSRLRPRLRERHLAEAGELYGRAQQARAEVQELTRQLEQLGEREGGPRQWAAQWTREQAERAETTYPQDREQAQLLDERELDFTYQRIGWRQAGADTAADTITALSAEQQLRIDMPGDQATIEKRLRDSWQHEQRQIGAARRAEEAEHQAEYYRHYEPHTQEQSHEHEQGMEMEM